MKKLVMCALAAALCASTASVAQDYRGDRYDRHDRYDDRGRDNRYDRRPANFVPDEFRRDRFVFANWRQRGLKQPARGQAWLRVCDSFILTSMRSGRIEEVHVAGRGRVNVSSWRLPNGYNCR